MTSTEITGIVLAGGKSSRMGFDKSMMTYVDKPLILHAVEKLKLICSKVVISANDNRYQFTGCEIWHDEIPVSAPMAGIYSCLKKTMTELNVVLSCDMPLVDHRLLLELIRVRKDELVILPMHEDDRREPLCAVYSKKAYVLMEDFISKRQYGLLRFADAAGCRLLDCNKLGFYHPRQFVNVNTITDFDLLNQS